MKIGLLCEIKPVKIPSGCPSDIYMEFENIELIQAIIYTLERMGHTILLIDTTKDPLGQLSEHRNEIDLIFNYSVGFGSRSREIIPAAMGEFFRIPYTGSDPMAQALAANKHVTKLIATYEGVPTPNWHHLSRETDIRQLEVTEQKRIVKPTYEGSSIGITRASIVQGQTEVGNLVKGILARYNQSCIVEDFIEGFEITVPVLGNTLPTALPPVCLQINGEIICGENVFGSELKANTDPVSWTAALPLSKSTVRSLQKWGVKMHQALGCRDISRSDFRVSSKEDIFFLELNTTPQLTPEGGAFATAGKEIGLEYCDILSKIVSSARKRYGNYSQNQSSLNS